MLIIKKRSDYEKINMCATNYSNKCNKNIKERETHDMHTFDLSEVNLTTK